MSALQKAIQYAAIGFAVFLAVSIFAGIFSAIGALGGFFDGGAVTEDVKAYEFTSAVSSLEVNINAADFTIKQGDRFCVESNLKHLTVENKAGVLTIKETKKLASTYSGAMLTLYIPENTVFEKAAITTGAGRLTVDALSAGKLNLELGAGEVKIDTLIATSHADIDGGAGEITISGGALHDLDFDMGVGQLNFTSALTGESEFDLGVGQSNITVIGNKDDYRLDVEKGLGNITVDGTSVSNMKGFGNGDNHIDISGGIGAIHVKFREKEAE